MEARELVREALRRALLLYREPAFYVALRWWDEGGDVMEYWMELAEACSGRRPPPLAGAAARELCTNFRWHDEPARCVGVDCSLSRALGLDVGRDHIFALMDRYLEEVGLGGVRPLAWLRRELLGGRRGLSAREEEAEEVAA